MVDFSLVVLSIDRNETRALDTHAIKSQSYPIAIRLLTAATSFGFIPWCYVTFGHLSTSFCDPWTIPFSQKKTTSTILFRCRARRYPVPACLTCSLKGLIAHYLSPRSGLMWVVCSLTNHFRSQRLLIIRTWYLIKDCNETHRLQKLLL